MTQDQKLKLDHFDLPSHAPDDAPPYHNDLPEPVLGLPTDRASAMLPTDLLQGDETIILLLKPSLWYILLSSLRVIGVIAVAFAVVFVLREYYRFDTDTIFSLACMLALVRLCWGFFDWMGRTYVLTDRRVIRIQGVVRIAVFQTELSKIQHTELHFSIRERLVGLGTISFATAGTGYPEAYWINIDRPLSVHRKVMQAISRYR